MEYVFPHFSSDIMALLLLHYIIYIYYIITIYSLSLSQFKLLEKFQDYNEKKVVITMVRTVSYGIEFIKESNLNCTLT